MLGDDFARLPPEVRASHQTLDVSEWRGRAAVRRGPGLWAAALAALFGFPPESPDTPVEVTKTVTPLGETWERRFGPRRFRSRLRATPRGMTESFGPFTFLLGLRVEEGALHYPVVSGRIGPLPLPGWLLPGSVAREYLEGGRLCFEVQIQAPLTGGLLVHYRGWLARTDPPPGALPTGRVGSSAGDENGSPRDAQDGVAP